MRRKLLAAATVTAWVLGVVFAAFETLHGMQDIALAAGITGMVWLLWTRHVEGLEFRAGYWQGRADEAQAMRVQARD